MVGVEKECQRGAVDTRRRFHDMGNEPFFSFGIEVRKILTRVLSMGLEVEVGAVGDAFQLVPPPWEPVVDVVGPGRIMRQLVRIMLAELQILLPHPHFDIPALPLLHPVFEPAVGLVGAAEELHLHLLELPGPEDELLRGDLIAERFADLGDSEGEPLAGGPLHVLEVDEDALRGLRAQIHRVVL